MPSIIGEKFHVIVDYKIGEFDPMYPNIKCQLNCGHIENVIDASGEIQKAYVLGVETPIETFDGRLIAIIHRLNDMENKWVIANRDFTKEEIFEAVSFYEKYFKIEILM